VSWKGRKPKKSPQNMFPTLKSVGQTLILGRADLSLGGGIVFRKTGGRGPKRKGNPKVLQKTSQFVSGKRLVDKGKRGWESRHEPKKTLFVAHREKRIKQMCVLRKAKVIQERGGDGKVGGSGLRV